MSMFDDKYFAYVTSSYGITLLVLAGMVLWARAQFKSRTAKLDEMEKLGITRRSQKR